MSDVLPINEMFVTMQGEAHWTGTPSIFIRLQGCPVGCPWCDTKHTWEQSHQHYVDRSDIYTKTTDGPSWSGFDVPVLVGWCVQQKPRHVVLTGGEPCMEDLRPLTTALIERGFTVQIETSGTFEVLCDSRTWVTVSPKVNMPGGRKLEAQAITRANELKMPVGKQRDVNAISTLLEAYGDAEHPLVWLQPLSQSEKATALCVEAATDNGWRVSIQTHKYLGVR